MNEKALDKPKGPSPPGPMTTLASPAPPRASLGEGFWTRLRRAWAALVGARPPALPADGVVRSANGVHVSAAPLGHGGVALMLEDYAGGRPTRLLATLSAEQWASLRAGALDAPPAPVALDIKAALADARGGLDAVIYARCTGEAAPPDMLGDESPLTLLLFKLKGAETALRRAVDTLEAAR